ncbi:hypothetical protein CAPTEDRAFT_227948 [Capitella teleta]|uniref:Peptidase M14 domain-containing protein n=1 Tax=Capitella teleta TaxID=283909 RepID=R7TK44_CAPTE|nr:hypothetical protein CAPTEDRAFT_227948 [Capitella teleta]|eukprot:ELT94089.1 hypothetical protein CAPTEDRAFT_227948 [Capitella teleta]
MDHATELSKVFRTLFFLVTFTLVWTRDVKPKQELYLPDYRVYHNLSSIQSELENIAYRNPKFIRMDWAYGSRDLRPQMVMRVTNFSSEGWTYTASQSMPRAHNKLKMLLSYGEHAREFLPVESMFHLLKNLTSGLAYPRGSPEESFSRLILSKVDLYIVGIMNPDGRDYLERTENYCWRGTSSGVDLNRNFDWQFGGKGSSSKANDEEYHGERPFSEPECLVLTDLTLKHKFDAFFSLHSGIRQIYVPFADTESKSMKRLPENVDKMLELADRMSHSTQSRFTYGLAHQLNEYTADGTIFDYMAGNRKIPFSLAIELWGEGDREGARCFDLFNPPSEHLHIALRDIHALYQSMFAYLIEWKEEQQAEYTKMDAPTMTLNFLLLGLLLLLFLAVFFHSRFPTCLRLYPKRRVVSIRSLSSTFSAVTLAMRR